jgi:hypothetical protein
MVEGGPPELISIQCRDPTAGRPAPAGGGRTSPASGRGPQQRAGQTGERQ